MRETIDALALVFALFALALFLHGCGGAPQVGRQFVSASAIGLAETDVAAAEGYTAAHTHALAASDTREAYELAMVKWNQLERAIDTAARSLFAAEAALDAWDAASEEAWLDLAACVVASMREVIAAAEAVGLELPPSVSRAIGFAGTFARGICPGRA